MKEFVSALAQVRKAHDLLFDSNGGATALFSESLGPVTSPGGLSTGPRSSPGGQGVLSADKTN
jgi:hypothetical protein